MKKSILAILMACLMIFNISAVFAVGDAVKIEKKATDAYETYNSESGGEVGFSSGKAKLENVGDYVVFKLDNVVSGNYGLIFWAGTRTAGTQVVVSAKAEGGEYEEKLTGDVYKNNSTTSMAKSIFGTVSLPEGTVYIKLEVSAGNCRFEKIELEPVVAFEFSGVTVNGGDEILENGAEVLRSTSVIRVNFTGGIDKASVADGSVSLLCGEEAVEANVTANDTYIEINPTATLDYSTEYKIKVASVKNGLGDTTLENIEFGFKTSDEASDSGSGTIEDGEIAITARNVSFSGKLIDGNGIGLSGRNVKVYFEDGADAVADVTTENGGAFSFNHSIPKSMPSGDYSYSIVGEYMEEGETFTVTYDAEAAKALLTQEFNVTQHNTELSKPQTETIVQGTSGPFISFNGYPKDEQVFDVNIPETGSYIISMKGGCGDGMKMFLSYLPDGADEWVMINEFDTISTGGSNVFAYQKAGAADFEEGPIKIKIGIYSTDMHFMGIKVEYADPVYTDAKSTADFADLTVSATMMSGSGKPMEGKNYEVYLKNPDGEISDEPIKTGVTDKDGLVFADITMAETDACGTYTFVIKSEDIPEDAEVPVVYVSKELETEIANAIKNTENIDDVKAILAANESNLTIDLEADLSGLTENEVYAHMVGADVDTIDEIKKLYKASIALETINQTTKPGKIGEVLADAKACEALGIDKDAIELLTEESMSALLTAICNLDRIESIDDVPETIEALVYDKLATQLGKTALTSLAENVKVEAGSGAEVSLGFEETIKDVKKITYYIKADNALLENASISSKFAVAKKTISGDEMQIVFEKSTMFNDVSGFGTVYLSTEKDADEYEVNISADIVYGVKVETDEGTIVVDVPNVMTEKTITIETTPKKNADTPSRPSSSSPSGVSRPSGDGPAIPDVPVTPDVPDTPATPEPPVDEKFEFVDLKEASWAIEAVEKLLEKGIVSESEDKKFNPNDNVKREEFIKMVVLASGIYNDAAESNFTDVAEDSWYYKYVASAYENGIITGRDGNLFGAGDYITREEMAAIIYRAYRDSLAKAEADELFADDSEIAEWAKEAVYALKEQNIVNGMGDNLFAPGENVTRAMSAKVIAGLLK